MPADTPPAKIAAPWSTPTDWQAANQSFSHLIRLHDPAFAPVRAAALLLAERLATLSNGVDRLCRATCRFCPKPCCDSAWAWFDFKDLLFMHLCGMALPGGQTLSAPGDRCRYLGPRGCRLPRLARPWVCTWYACPPQAARLRRMPAARREAVEGAVKQVKAERSFLATAFIRITTGYDPEDCHGK